MLGSVEINRYRAFIIVVTAVLTALSWLIMYRTPFGTQVRAIIRNPKMAEACGIDVAQVNALTFALGSGLAGVAGVMMSGFKTVFPDMGTPMVVDGFHGNVVDGRRRQPARVGVFQRHPRTRSTDWWRPRHQRHPGAGRRIWLVIMIIILKPKACF